MSRRISPSCWVRVGTALPQHPDVGSVRLQADRVSPAKAGHYVRRKHALTRWLLVVIERDREEGHRIRILRRQRLDGVGGEDGVVGGAVERVDARGRHDGDVGDSAVLVDVEGEDDASPERHRRVRDEPVAPDLRDKAADPGTELDAFGVELDRRPGIVDAPLWVAERLVLDVALQVPERVAEPAWRRT